MPEKVEPLLVELGRELEALARQSRAREFSLISRGSGESVLLSGQAITDFSSHDFFDVRLNARLRRFAHEAVESFGVGGVSPRLSSGTTPLHIGCEAALARFFGAESALLFSSRTQATFSLLTSILSERDAVLVEDGSSLPVLDAAYLVNATAVTYPAGNLTALAAELEKLKGMRRRFVVVDTVSPFTGEVVNALPLIDVLQRHSADIILDESMALGLVGARGAGFSELVGVLGSRGILCRVADLGAALASYGCALVGPAALVSFIVNRSRTLLNEPALPPLFAAHAEAALHWVELQSAIRDRLASASRRFVGRLKPLLKASGGEVPIVCLPTASFREAMEIRAALLSRRFLCDALQVRTHLGEAGVVRFFFRASHTDLVIEGLSQALEELSQRNVPRGTF